MRGMGQPTFAFADDTPVQKGRKHRGRRTNNNAATHVNNSNNTNGAANQNSSYGQGGQKYSRAASMSAQNQRLNLQPSKANTYCASDTNSKGNNTNNTNNEQDQNSCAGSLTYSASSSVQSAESSNDSSFADIIKLIDSEGEGASEIKEFMARQSKAANDGSAGVFIHGMKGAKKSSSQNPAVQGWMQRVEDRSRAHQAQQQMAQAQTQTKAQAHKKKQQPQHQQYTMAASKHVPNSHVDLNYSKDDSSEEDVYGVDFDDENVLETIGGLDDDQAGRHSATASTQPQVKPKASRKHADPFRGGGNQDPHSSPYSSAPSSPKSQGSSGHFTPPPNSRSQKRTSTPPGANPISRTNSRHSKSSSDGSWDTPAPSSPPHMGTNGSNNSKPPSARNTPKSKSRRKNGRDEKAIEDLSEAFYAKSWMCGFADAFNFDGFDKFQK